MDDGRQRQLSPALIRGWKRRCPSCGQGHILSGFLSVHDSCDACGEAFHHHRADDGPAYLTILIVGHLMAPAFLWAFMEYRPSPAVLIAVFSIGCMALILYLLPRLKGAMIALQWAKRMHGFGSAP